MSTPRETGLKVAGVAGAVVGYGGLLAFLYVVGLQTLRWFREGEWTHIGLNEGLRAGLERCCVKDGDSGHLADLMQWIDAPVNWLGMHKVMDVLPASLAIFAVSIAGNCVFNYCKDRLENR